MCASSFKKSVWACPFRRRTAQILAACTNTHKSAAAAAVLTRSTSCKLIQSSGVGYVLCDGSECSDRQQDAQEALEQGEFKQTMKAAASKIITCAARCMKNCSNSSKMICPSPFTSSFLMSLPDSISAWLLLNFPPCTTNAQHTSEPLLHEQASSVG